MPSGFFLEIVSKANGKIKGGAKSKACPDQIAITNWHWEGVRSTASMNSGGGTGKPKNAVLHEATFSAPMSIASHALMHAAATGDPPQDGHGVGAYGREGWRGNHLHAGSIQRRLRGPLQRQRRWLGASLGVFYDHLRGGGNTLPPAECRWHVGRGALGRL